MRCRRITGFLFFVCIFIFSDSNTYCQDFDKVEITTEKVTGNIFIHASRPGRQYWSLRGRRWGIFGDGETVS